MRPRRLLTMEGPPGYLRGFVAAGMRVDRLATPSTDPLQAWQMAQELGDAVRDVDQDHTRRGLKRGAYDAVLCHTALDLPNAMEAGAPVVVVLHERRDLLDLFGDGPATWDAVTRDAFEHATIVFAGDDVAHSWALDGPVIPAAIQTADWRPSTGQAREAVTVAPFAMERAILDTAYLLSTLVADPGITILGMNPGLGIDVNSASLPERRRAFARARVYVNLSNPAAEPAAPSAMLDAMAAALPVVTLAHACSPIVHGVNGLVAQSAEELARFTRQLLDEPALARRLGASARQTVEASYSQNAFTTRWTELLMKLPRTDAARTA
jgi:hypothetical protein